MARTSLRVQRESGFRIVRLLSPDHTNRLTQSLVQVLLNLLRELAGSSRPLIIAGNQEFFSAGADLCEVQELTAVEAYAFSRKGQDLMKQVECFPAPVYAAIEGYCMGGGLDLALACARRIASPRAVFGHRGAGLGLVTGWGGTQRLRRLIGRATAVELLICATRLSAEQALALGLIDSLAGDPLAQSISQSCR
ncbi:MAG: enoyl-CoA hydratase/isomerase family protein [Acidobacteria bacterium]|nr:enoyl-CoA hydratase/isomerase family protein [Acidobacteriota bacterium]